MTTIPRANAPFPYAPWASTTSQAIAPARTEAKAQNGGAADSSSQSKVYVYRNGGGTVKLEPAAGAAAAAAPSPDMDSNVVINTSGAVDAPAKSGYSYFPVGRRHPDLESEVSTFTAPWDKSATAKGSRLSQTTVRTAPQSRFSECGTTGFGGGGGDGRSVCRFEETNHGAFDNVMDTVGRLSAHGGASGSSDSGSGIDEHPLHPSRAASGSTAENATGYPYPRSFSASTPSPTPTRTRHAFMGSPVVRAFSKRPPEGSEYSMDEPAWNGDLKKSSGFPGWSVLPSTPCNHRIMQKRSTSSCVQTLEMGGPTSMLRFVNGRSNAYPPPPPPSPGDRHLLLSGRFSKKPRFPLTTITGAAMRPHPNEDGATAATEAPTPSLDSVCNRHTDFGSAAENATCSFGKYLSVDTCTPTAAGSTEQQLQLVELFPSSVSLAEQTSLRLAFGSALTQKEWLLGTSTLLDAELNLY